MRMCCAAQPDNCASVLLSVLGIVRVFFANNSLMVLAMKVRLVAINFFERGLKDINFHFCLAQSL